MEVIVNCNDDTIILKVNKTDDILFSVKRPYEVAMLLENLFNFMGGNIDCPLNISLTLINEDVRKTLGEW